jgi:uncharacterized protein (DUF58 family)
MLAENADASTNSAYHLFKDRNLSIFNRDCFVSYSITFMLLAQLEELLELRHQADRLGLTSSHRVKTPLSGLYASVFRGQGVDFDEVREYRYGDEIRYIDWRVTARMRKPYLKVYREERERHVVLCVDIHPYMQFGTRRTFKSVQAARAAALLGWSAQCHGDRVSGLLFGDGKPQFFRPDHSSFWRLLRSLTLPSTGAEPTLTVEQTFILLDRSIIHGSLIFIVTDGHQILLPILSRILTKLRQRHEVVFITLEDPADYELPAMGKIRFVSTQGTSLIVDTDHSQGRSRYRQAWQQQREQLQQLLRRLNIDLISIATEADVYQSLLTGLRQRMQQQQAHR